MESRKIKAHSRRYYGDVNSELPKSDNRWGSTGEALSDQGPGRVTDPAQAPPRDGFALRLAFLYAALATVFGIQLPFFPLWLKARGLDPQAIGLVLAAPIVVRIFAVPLINRAVDHWAAWSHGLWRAAASCVAVAVVCGSISLFAPQATDNSGNDLSQDFENTLLASADQSDTTP